MASFARATSRAWAEISRDALAHNLALLQERYGHGGRTRLLAVVKADAYGHGIDLIAPLCAEAGIMDFGVATVDEGIRLRALLPPQAALYLLAATLPADAPEIVAHRLVPLVSDRNMGRALSEAAAHQNTHADAHLDVDTGIGRAGASADTAPALLAELDALPSLHITGLATHFACADEDPADAAAQNAQFERLRARLGARAQTLVSHAANSPAALALPAASCGYDLIRPGLLLYGIEPAPGMLAAAGLPLRPVLTLRARVLLCRRLPEGATISYGRTFTVPRGGGVYATIGLGYGDGWPRRLGEGVGDVLLHGQRAPICGRVCMDQFVVDVSRIPGVAAGDAAILIGTDGTETITAAGLAAAIGTTPHEITTCLTARVPRVLVP